MTDRDFVPFVGDPMLEVIEDGRAVTRDVGEAACGSVDWVDGVCLPGIGRASLVATGDGALFASIESTCIDEL